MRFFKTKDVHGKNKVLFIDIVEMTRTYPFYGVDSLLIIEKL